MRRARCPTRRRPAALTHTLTHPSLPQHLHHVPPHRPERRDQPRPGRGAHAGCGAPCTAHPSLSQSPLPPSSLCSAAGPGMADLAQTRNEVVHEVLKAPERRLDNMVTCLYDSTRLLMMHARVVDAVRADHRSMEARKWGMSGAVMLLGQVRARVAPPCAIACIDRYRPARASPRWASPWERPWTSPQPSAASPSPARPAPTLRWPNRCVPPSLAGSHGRAWLVCSPAPLPPLRAPPPSSTC